MLSDTMRYRKVIHAIGLAMLTFWGLFMGYSFVITFLSTFVFTLLPPVPAEVVYQLLYGAGYLLTFMLPAWFLKLFLKGCHVPPEPMGLSLRLTWELPWIIFAGIAVIFAAAELNASMVSIIDYNEFLGEMMGEETAPATYQWVLQCIVIGFVPGFCEEFLFRGAIQTNCRPFGRTVAILISALLFSFMHQNAGQSLYTFAAGIVLGLVYEWTGNIWASVILHTCNNVTSVMQSVLYYQFADEVAANAALVLLQVVIYLLGALSVGILILRAAARRPDFKSGIFGRRLPQADTYARCPIAPKRALRLFFRPTMVIFLSLCMLEILMLLLMAAIG